MAEDGERRLLYQTRWEEGQFSHTTLFNPLNVQVQQYCVLHKYYFFILLPLVVL